MSTDSFDFLPSDGSHMCEKFKKVLAATIVAVAVVVVAKEEEEYETGSEIK